MDLLWNRKSPQAPGSSTKDLSDFCGFQSGFWPNPWIQIADLRSRSVNSWPFLADFGGIIWRIIKVHSPRTCQKSKSERSSLLPRNKPTCIFSVLYLINHNLHLIDRFEVIFPDFEGQSFIQSISCFTHIALPPLWHFTERSYLCYAIELMKVNDKSEIPKLPATSCSYWSTGTRNSILAQLMPVVHWCRS